MEWIKKSMECAMCQKLVPASITHFCTGVGHLLCHECAKLKPKNDDGFLCPVENCLDDGDRSHIIEIPSQLYNELYNSSYFKCKFCYIIVKGCEVAGHTEMCSFRPILRCPFSKCEEILARPEFIEHLSVGHQVAVQKSAAECIGINVDREQGPSTERISWVSSIIDCWDEKFFLTVEKFNQNFTIWVSAFGDHVGGPSKFKVFLKVRTTAEVKNNGLEGIKKVHLYTDEVTSEKIRATGQCIYITGNEVPKLTEELEDCGNSRYLLTEVRILKLQEKVGPGQDQFGTNELDPEESLQIQLESTAKYRWWSRLYDFGKIYWWLITGIVILMGGIGFSLF